MPIRHKNIAESHSELAALTFEDTRCLVVLDRIDESGEQRWQAIGVAHTGPTIAAVLLLYTLTEDRHRTGMARKLSASSRPAGLKSMSSEDIKNRQWTKKELQALHHAGKNQAAGDDSDINFKDVPRLIENQLASMVRLRDVRLKVPVSVEAEHVAKSGH